MNFETSKVRKFVKWILSKMYLNGLGIEKIFGAAGGTDALRIQLKEFLRSKKAKRYFKLYLDATIII